MDCSVKRNSVAVFSLTLALSHAAYCAAQFHPPVYLRADHGDYVGLGGAPFKCCPSGFRRLR